MIAHESTFNVRHRKKEESTCSISICIYYAYRHILSSFRNYFPKFLFSLSSSSSYLCPEVCKSLLVTLCNEINIVIGNRAKVVSQKTVDKIPSSQLLNLNEFVVVLKFVSVCVYCKFMLNPKFVRNNC